MSEGPAKRRPFLWWISRIARFVMLPRGIAYGEQDYLGKIVDWLPTWALFIAIPLAVAAAMNAGFWVAQLIRI